MKQTINNNGYVYETMVASQWHELVHFVRGFCRGRFTPEDIVQDAMMRAWLCWPEWTPDDPENAEKNCRAWMFRISANLVLDRAKATKRMETGLRRATEDTTSWCYRPGVGAIEDNRAPRYDQGGVGTNRIDRYPAAEPIVVPTEVGPEVQEALSRLTPGRRDIVRARFVDDKDSNVIARERKLKRVTVRTSLMRALDDLVPMLETYARQEYGIQRESGPRAFTREAPEREQPDADSINCVVAEDDVDSFSFAETSAHASPAG